MPSSLRERLSALKSQSNKQPAPVRTGGLLMLSGNEKVPESLYSISSAALRRIGGSGRAFDIEKCLFIDTETTGLAGGAGTIAFLVGAGFIKDGRMTIKQFFMRDYPDEIELLDKLKTLMAGFDTVVTFNGRTFDMPLIRQRFIMNRFHDFKELDDLDLIYPSRRVWKKRIVSCKLSSIEEKILGIKRENDIPGSEVPEHWFDFLKTGDMSLVNDIIRHNYQDILSLAFLLDKLIKVYDAPEKQEEVLDVYSLGRVLENQGETSQAIRLYRLSALPKRLVSASSLKGILIAGEANRRLVKLLLRERKYDEAVKTLEQMITRKQMGVFPYIELAKIYEHRLGDCVKALEYTLIALDMCPTDEKEAIIHREKRLREKIEIKKG